MENVSAGISSVIASSSGPDVGVAVGACVGAGVGVVAAQSKLVVAAVEALNACPTDSTSEGDALFGSHPVDFRNEKGVVGRASQEGPTTIRIQPVYVISADVAAGVVPFNLNVPCWSLINRNSSTWKPVGGSGVIGEPSSTPIRPILIS